MSKYYKPVFSYKLSFDPNKEEKHTLKVIFTVVMDGEGRISAAIPPPAEGAVAAPVTCKVQTRTAKVRICKTNAMDEVLFTIKVFKRAWKVTRMSWTEAAYNFANCLGQVPQTKVDELVHDYLVTKQGYRQMIQAFIQTLCFDENAKGTLKQSIKKGNWIKPEDVEI